MSHSRNHSPELYPMTCQKSPNINMSPYRSDLIPDSHNDLVRYRGRQWPPPPNTHTHTHTHTHTEYGVYKQLRPNTRSELAILQHSVTRCQQLSIKNTLCYIISSMCVCVCHCVCVCQCVCVFFIPSGLKHTINNNRDIIHQPLAGTQFDPVNQ